MRTSWKLVGNPGCQLGLATSFQLVRLVGCGLNRYYTVIVEHKSSCCALLVYNILFSFPCLFVSSFSYCYFILNY